MVFQLIFGNRKEIPLFSCDTPNVDPRDRIYAIGDIQSRRDLLDTMIAQVLTDVAQTSDERQVHLVFLGNYIDYGDETKAAIDALIALSTAPQFSSITFLRGSREAALLRFINNPNQHPEWLRQGGLKTCVSYGVVPPMSISDVGTLKSVRADLQDAMGRHLDFIRNTALHFRSGSAVFVHAGIDPNAPIEEQPEAVLLGGNESFLENGGIEGLRVIHGHFPGRTPVVTAGRVCLDTDAYQSGTLSAIRLDQNQRLFTAKGQSAPPIDASFILD